MKFTQLLILLVPLTFTFTDLVAAREVDKRHPSARKERPTAKEVEEERAWIAVEKGSVASLEKYLAKRPRGSRYKEATLFLPLAKRLEGIATGKIQAAVTIPLEEYGEDWKPSDRKVGAAVSYNRTQRIGEHTGGFWLYGSPDFEDPAVFSPGKFGDGAFSRWPLNVRAGNGSLIAFDTAGDECPLRERPIIVSEKNNIVYFGVVDGVGLVHIAGAGRVIFKDGKVVKFR